MWLRRLLVALVAVLSVPLLGSSAWGDTSCSVSASPTASAPDSSSPAPDPTPSPSAGPTYTPGSPECPLTVKLDETQYVVGALFAGTALLLGCAGFVVTHGRPWRA